VCDSWLRSGGRFGFLFGREDVIPEMFKRLLSLWEHWRSRSPYFAYYLNGILNWMGTATSRAREMLMTLARHDESSWKQATCAAERAIISRIKLWDRVQTHIKTGSNSASNGLAAGSRTFP
jgi:hypothetical protein